MLELGGHQMGDHLGVGFGLELRAFGFELLTQLPEIFDDAVVHDGHALGGMRMGIVLVGPAVGRPAGMADPDGAGERTIVEPLLEILQLSFGPPAREASALQRRDPSGIVAAIFEALERIDDLACDRLAAQNSDDPAHRISLPPGRAPWRFRV